MLAAQLRKAELWWSAVIPDMLATSSGGCDTPRRGEIARRCEGRKNFERISNLDDQDSHFMRDQLVDQERGRIT